MVIVTFALVVCGCVENSFLDIDIYYFPGKWWQKKSDMTSLEYCAICNQQFQTKETLLSHQRGFHKMAPSKKKNAEAEEDENEEMDEADKDKEEEEESSDEDEDEEAEEDENDVWGVIFRRTSEMMVPHSLPKDTDMLEDENMKPFLKRVGEVVWDIMHTADKIRENPIYETLQTAAEKIQDKGSHLTEEYAMEVAFKKYRYLLKPILEDHIDEVNAVLFPDGGDSEEEEEDDV